MTSMSKGVIISTTKSNVCNNINRSWLFGNEIVIRELKKLTTISYE